MTRKEERIQGIKKTIEGYKKSLANLETQLKEVEAASDDFPNKDAKALIKKRDALWKKVRKGLKIKTDLMQLDVELDWDENVYVSKFIIKSNDPIIKGFWFVFDDAFNNDPWYLLERLESQKILSKEVKTFYLEFEALRREVSGLMNEIEDFEDLHGELE